MKIPPNDFASEQAILGSMLIDKLAVIEAANRITHEYFYRPEHQIIFEAMENLFNKNIPIDLLTVTEELTTAKMFDKVGGYEYLATLPDTVPTTANIEQYVDIVEEKYNLRQIIETGNQMISLGFDDSRKSDDILNLAEQNIFDLTIKKNTVGVEDINKILSQTIVNLEELSKNKTDVTGVPSGFIDLDARTGGFQKSNLIILAARPGMGKSALAINIATHVAAKEDKTVLVFNLEMSKNELAKRILSSEAMINNDKLNKGMMSAEDWQKIAVTSGNLSEAKLFIDDTPGINMMEIRSRARKLKMEREDLSLVVIDYLQLIEPLSKKNATREQEISEISRSLKILAKELDVPIIAISQLSRNVERAKESSNKKPQLSDLRESGAIEQDADMVLFIFREGYYDKDTELGNQAQIIIAKHRGGSTGEVDVLWMPEYTKFVNLGRSEE